MRLLLMFALTLHAIHAELVSIGGKKVTHCPQLIGKSGKHHWEVEQFLGKWSGVELYSHFENQTNDDTCLRLKITEVNEKSVDEADPIHLSLRHLLIEFSYSTRSLPMLVVLNMSNVGVWKADDATVQVLKSDPNQLMMTVCEPKTSKLYTILLNKNIEEEDFLNAQKVNEMILQVRNLKVYSTSSLQTNCTVEPETEKSGGKQNHVSFISILFVFIAKILIA